MDALDLPAVAGLEASYAIEGNIQNTKPDLDSSQTRYIRAGLVPYESLGRKAALPDGPLPVEGRDGISACARNDHAEQQRRATGLCESGNGRRVHAGLGFSALMLRPGETLRPNRRSSSAVFHVIEGSGEANVDGKLLKFEDSDVVAIPTHADIEIANRSTSKPCYLFQVDDAPMQRKLGFFEEFH